MKGYILIDIPKECDKCLFRDYNEYTDGFYCNACYDKDGRRSKYLKRGLQLPKSFKPDWCPIKQLPEFEAKLGTYKEDWLYVEGYSACLKKILGDETNELD